MLTLPSATVAVVEMAEVEGRLELEGWELRLGRWGGCDLDLQRGRRGVPGPPSEPGDGSLLRPLSELR